MFSESSSESMCTRDSNLAVKCEFRFNDDSVSDYEYGGCSMCSSDSDDSVSDQSKRSRGHAWLMHIQNVNLPVDVEVEMSLSDWSGNLGPTRGVISLARKFPNLEQLEQNLIFKLAAFGAESDITIAT